MGQRGELAGGQASGRPATPHPRPAGPQLMLAKEQREPEKHRDDGSQTQTQPWQHHTAQQRNATCRPVPPIHPSIHPSTLSTHARTPARPYARPYARPPVRSAPLLLGRTTAHIYMQTYIFTPSVLVRTQGPRGRQAAGSDRTPTCCDATQSDSARAMGRQVTTVMQACCIRASARTHAHMAACPPAHRRIPYPADRQ
ncbi:hypothetical protein BS50DRAFT_149632 [Corynespora cassiicola Philippines]|uniref:Uncharacterized protein n=1 Tax=Corynespora cassiicola Philippines TaxID=1448308 RepID=A0A2T2N7F0_CORCC|nr:hypothetical protein BS50DRAFT_149632 [Corynespora cassiicola Philippines]